MNDPEFGKQAVCLNSAIPTISASFAGAPPAGSAIFHRSRQQRGKRAERVV